MSIQTCAILFVVLFGLVSAATLKESKGEPQCVDNTLYIKYACEGKKDGVKFLLPGKCSEYIECSKNVSKVNTCPKFFDPLTQKCVSKSDCVEVDNTDCVIPTPPPCNQKPPVDPPQPPPVCPPQPPPVGPPQPPPVCPPVGPPQPPPVCPPQPPPVCPPAPECPPIPECPSPPICPPAPECPSTPAPPNPPGPPCPGCAWPGGPCDPPFDPNDLYGSFVCRNQSDGTMLINPKSCKDYYYCINGFSYRKSCGKGQLFNPEVNACDVEENVYCPSSRKLLK